MIQFIQDKCFTPLGGWIYVKRLEWEWLKDEAPFSLSAWWWCVKNWWRRRPMKIYCDSGCGTPMWHNGPPVSETYCSESCASYGTGAFTRAESDEIPF